MKKLIRKKYKELIQNEIQNYDWNANNGKEYTEKIHTLLYEKTTKSIRKYKISYTILNDK